MDKREQLRIVFEDTQKFYTENTVLAAAVAESRQGTKLYEAEGYLELPILGSSEKSGELAITHSRTFEAAIRLSRDNPGKKIAVLNFASATRPGGGVKNGSSAQEEALCRCSTLYPTLDCRWLWQCFYDINRAANDVRHSDACIYSPGVVICKTDESLPKRMKPEDWVTVDVISCAAPNLRSKPSNQHNPETGASQKVTDAELYEIHLKRAKRILTIAAANKVDILVLGAFGCGAFCNDPKVVAQAYHAAISEFRHYFDKIEFAVYDGPHSNNYDVFHNILKVLV